MTNNREYRIAMNSLTAIAVMGALDSAASELEDGSLRDNLNSVVKQIDKEHTRFLNDPINLENDMSTEKSPIVVSVDEIKHDRLITGFAFNIIQEAIKTGTTESALIEEIENRMRELVQERMGRQLDKG